MEKKKIIINGIEEEIYVVSDKEKENNLDLINLEDTVDLSEVIDHEWVFRKNKVNC